MTSNLGREREAAAQLQASYREKVQAIRDNPDLSAEGRQRQIADLYASTKAKLKSHREAERTKLDSRFRELEAELFVAPRPLMQDSATYAISVRDASDRAAQLQTPDDAQQLLRRALANRDEVLARAVVAHAMDKSNSALSSVAAAWEGVCGAFIAERPHLTRVVEELGEVEQMTQRDVFSPFSLPAPTDVPLAVINGAASGAPMAEAAS